MRTGKSKAIIDQAEYLFHKGEIEALIVVAPNGVHENWVRKEIPFHCSTPYSAMAYRASSAEARWHKKAFGLVTKAQQVAYKLQIFCINAESIRTEKGKAHLTDFIRGRRGKVMICVDESHMFRTPSSARTRVIKAFAKQCKWRRIMTGTLANNSPLHAWSQFEILEQGALGFRKYNDFKRHYAIEEKQYGAGGRSYDTVVGYRNTEQLKAEIAKWTSVVTKKDAGIEELNHVERTVGMSPKQEQLFKTVKKECMVDGIALEGAGKMMKLQQIAQGWYYDEYGQPKDVVSVKDDMLLAAIISEIENSDGKGIVWCRFDHDIARMAQALERAKINYVIYKGGMSNDAKNNALDRFRGNPAVKIFLGQPMSGGVGLPLEVADYIIWHSLTFDAIVWEQANERASEVDGDIVDLITFCVDNTPIAYIIRTLQEKKNVSDDIAGKGLQNILLIEELV